MTKGEFELFEIKADDFMRDLMWFARQSRGNQPVVDALRHLADDLARARVRVRDLVEEKI